MLDTTDTLDIYERLKKLFTEEQAHELSQMFALIDSGASTNGRSAKRNVTELEETMWNGFKEQEAKMQSGFKEQEAEMQSGFKEQEAHIKELDLKIEATQHSIKELDLKIESTQHSIKELDLKIESTQHSIKELDLKIESTQHNIKELDLKIEATQHNVKELDIQIVRTQTEMVSAISDSKVEIIKWVVGLFFLQVSMLVGLLAAYVGIAG